MNSKDWAIIRQCLENAIGKTVRQFRDNPWDFLSENDIQAVLFAELRDEMRHLRMKYVASCEKDRCLGESLDVSRVLTEYQLASEGHCDIAILCDEQDGDTLNLWQRPCRIGIEIKFWQAREYHHWNEPRGSKKDVEKLQRYWMRRNQNEQHFTGIAMLFRHPGAVACQEVDEVAVTDPEVGYPENGVAIHVVSNEGHCWNEARVSTLTGITAPNTN